MKNFSLIIYLNDFQSPIEFSEFLLNLTADFLKENADSDTECQIFIIEFNDNYIYTNVYLLFPYIESIYLDK